MSLATHIVKRKASAHFYLRLHVPEDVKPAIGKRTIWQTLRTTDARLAKSRAAALIHRWQTSFDDVRRRRNATPHDLTTAAWSHYTTGLDRDARERADLPGQADLDRERARAIEALSALPESQREGLAGMSAALEYMVALDAPKIRERRDELRAKALRKHLATGETALIAHAADAFIQAAGLAITRASPDYAPLPDVDSGGTGSVGARTRARCRRLDRHAARSCREPPAPGSTPQMAAPGETIMELFARFRKEKYAAVTPDT